MNDDMSQKQKALSFIVDHPGLSSFELEKLAIGQGICGETIRRRTRELVEEKEVHKTMIDGQTHWYPGPAKKKEPEQLKFI